MRRFFIFLFFFAISCAGSGAHNRVPLRDHLDPAGGNPGAPESVDIETASPGSSSLSRTNHFVGFITSSPTAIEGFQTTNNLLMSDPLIEVSVDAVDDFSWE